jgi:hypothetical protein
MAQGQDLVQLGALIQATILVSVIAVLIVLRNRLGVLRVASWLVIWGAAIVASEHVFFAIAYSAPIITNEGPIITNEGPTILPHARVHFFMAGIYALVGLVMLSVIAKTLLKEGEEGQAGTPCFSHCYSAAASRSSRARSSIPTASLSMRYSQESRCKVSAGRRFMPISSRGGRPLRFHTDQSFEAVIPPGNLFPLEPSALSMSVSPTP